MLDLPKIAAVFATLDRSRTAESCVMALARQARPPEWVIVADNASTDDTVALLISLKDLPFKLVVHEVGKNLGNAGGVKEAMEFAFAEGADAVWILDDDSWPRENALKALLDEVWNPHVVRHALQINPKTGMFTWPMWIQGASGWELAFDPSELPEVAMMPSRSSWTGALVSKHVWNEVGPVNGELFIRGEDEEYPWRIQQAGFLHEAVLGAIMDHPGPEKIVHWRFFGKNFFFERGLAESKLYYKIRNMVWLKRRQAGDLQAVSIALTYCVAAILLDGPGRLGLLKRAINDGWRGRLGRM